MRSSMSARTLEWVFEDLQSPRTRIQAASDVNSGPNESTDWTCQIIPDGENLVPLKR